MCKKIRASSSWGKYGESYMVSIKIKSFSKYIEYIENNYGRQHIFRGQNSLAYKLIPKIGRDAYYTQCSSLDELQDLEEKTMRNFISMSVPYTDLRRMSSWDQWTIGQHHGLPTRFLDWTENPLIAAYFATENANDQDVAVYVTDREQFNSNTVDEEDVFSFSAKDEVLLHVPSYINARIISQKGLFTVHRDPSIPLDETELNGKTCVVHQIVIDHSIIKEFIDDLDWFGINRSFIYPGLDGLAYYLDLKAKGGIS